MGTNRACITGCALLIIAISSLFWAIPASSWIEPSHNGTHIIQLSSDITKFAESAYGGSGGSGITINTVSTNWTLTGIQLNLDGIKLDKETVIIEENGTSFLSIDKSRSGRAIQIQVTQQTTLFAVQIYGYLSGVLKSPVTVQIEGCTPITYVPNGTVFGTYIQLNISITPGWYTQQFPIPIFLNPGNYYLTIKGYSGTDNSKVFWFNNNVDPQYPALNISEYNGGSWSPGISGKPFRHIMVQRVVRTYNPEDIDMAVSVGNVTYPISNDVSAGTGELTLAGLSQAVVGTTLLLPVVNNNSVSLLFNYSARAFLEKHQIVNSTLTIHTGIDNEWKIEFSTIRAAVYYTVEVPIAPSWHDVVIWRNGINITAQTTINGNVLVIGNSSISDDDQFVVQAASPHVSLAITIPRLAFEPGQELKCSVQAPSSGNVTFEFYDALGFEEFVERRQVPPLNTTFSYTFSSNPYAGTGQVFVVWNNGTDAGSILQAITISVPIRLDPATVATFGIVAVSSVVGIAGSYKLVKFMKHRRQLYEQRIVERCTDIRNLQMLLVVDKRSGLNVYEQSFLDNKVEASLVAGFLDAIRTFGIGLSKSNEASQTIKLEFKSFKILMNEYMDFRLVLIMKENPSDQMTNALTALSYDIGRVFGDQLKVFNGYRPPFNGIKNLIRTHFNTDILGPLEIAPGYKVALTSKELDLLNSIKTKIALAGAGKIFITTILPERSCDFEQANNLFKLMEKGVLRPAGEVNGAS